MTVAAVLVNYNGGVANLEAIASLQNQVDEIVIVDNASEDDSVATVRAKFGDRVKIIETGENHGFGKACNIGAATVTSEYLLFFNNDAFAAPDMVSLLKARLEANPRMGIIGPVVYEYDAPDMVQSGLPTIDRWGFPLDALNGARRGDPRLSGEVSGFYVPGCALFLRRVLFEQLHGFDEGMFMFVEDVDLCWRAQILGYDVGLSSKAQCWHVGGASAPYGVEAGSYRTSETRIRLREQNTMRMMFVNLDLVGLLRYVFILAPMLLAEAILAFALGRRPIARAYFAAFSNVFKSLDDITARRRLIQRSRRRSEKDIERTWASSYGKFAALRRLGIPRLVSFTKA